MLKITQKAEGVLEYVLLIGVISLGLSTMNIYLKRGIQARIRDITQSSLAQTQFVSDRQESDFTTTQTTTGTLNTQGTTTTLNLNENIQRTGSETYTEPQNYWGGSAAQTTSGSSGVPQSPTY